MAVFDDSQLSTTLSTAICTTPMLNIGRTLSLLLPPCHFWTRWHDPSLTSLSQQPFDTMHKRLWQLASKPSNCPRRLRAQVDLSVDMAKRQILSSRVCRKLVLVSGLARRLPRSTPYMAAVSAVCAVMGL
ncbi:uncharacterized protein MAM_05721 [Metarhizium album ARSEF 1941]|uniref:Uncharacterized protein n=1 Tax=Metarhizium album (strain ARSEF 1941) TaxID=1081103 RepID=A0A0B2WSH1_METAS|nr:uncharacterized protein MAM_05721 [Metarhizium album ARSEF 1941]KHN96432.1 hypothetical protein MAM_05721 [Metarhizium album ARSEF 1941]